MLRVDRLSFEYPGQRVLEDITFDLPMGEITALVGPNGAGKTTLLRCLAALHPPFGGLITLDGVDIFDNPRRYHSHMGYLADNFGLYDDLTVVQSLVFAARRHQVSPAQVTDLVEETLHLLDLVSHRRHRAAELSRGLRQRLGIAQTIIHRPRLLLLDEPASGLDPEARIRLAQLFLTLQQQGMTLLISSHILAELGTYSNHMLVLRQGRLAGFESLHPKPDAPMRHLILGLWQPWPDLAAWLGQYPGISRVTVEGLTATCLLAGGHEAQAGLLRDLVARGTPLLSLAEHREDIQTRYLSRFGTQESRP